MILDFNVTFKNFNTNYSFEKNTKFVIDNDKNLDYIKNIPLSQYERLIICYDSGINNNICQKIFSSFQENKNNIVYIPVVSSESTKNLSFFCEFIEILQNHGCSRFDMIIAVGGGVIIDLISFVASTYMRGLPLILIPTTLIGQVDAATAGKTCLNTSNVKNLLGTFYYPDIVYNNVNFLSTQTEFFFRQGLSEVLKYGLLDSNVIIEKMRNFNNQNDLQWLFEIVELTIISRIKISKIDPLASNLGHTFGHAIEKLSNFEILHGDAINVGTVMALHFAMHEDLIAQNTVNNIILLMKKLKLNLYIDKNYYPHDFVKLMQKDKKSSSKNINLILIRDIGLPYENNGSRFYPVSPSRIEKFICYFLNNYEYAVANCLDKIKNLHLNVGV